MDLPLKLLILGLLLSLTSAQVDTDLSVQERCEKHGFGYEEYQVTTEDGYLLTLMRIPFSPDAPSVEGRAPILLAHPPGAVFLADDPDADMPPAFSLSTKGYDVWINNFRGTPASLDHLYMNPDTDVEYWDFDMVDLRLDLMAEIEFILDNVPYESVGTYGYAFAGSVISFAMAIEPDFFEQNMNLAALIVTSPSMAHSNSILWNLPAYASPILDYFRSIGLNSIMNYDSPVEEVDRLGAIMVPELLDGITSVVTGETNVELDNMASVQNLMSAPLSITMKLLEHFSQSARTQRVSYFDYGPQENLERYGTEEAPLIPLWDTRNMVIIMNAENDESVSREDTEWYAEILGDKLIDLRYYPLSHNGFITGDTDEYLTDLAELYDEFKEPLE